jgi:hypothetical protein
MYLAAKKLGRFHCADKPTTAMVLADRKIRLSWLMSLSIHTFLNIEAWCSWLAISEL